MKHIRDCLNNKIGAIYQHACSLRTIEPIVRKHLPELLKPHTTIGGLHQGCLILITHDAVWASQLRYELPYLRDILRKEAHLYQLRTIKINIVEKQSISKETNPSKSLSAIARSTIENLSEDCAFEPLKHALKQLARS